MPWLPRQQRIRPRRLHRATLRRAAIRYAEHSWDVVPGACLRSTRFDCGRPSCPTFSCHPAISDWETAASHDPRVVSGWWRRLPHTVLLATGRAFDVIDVPADLGRLTGSRVAGPVAAAPNGRWLFFVRPGFGLHLELHSQLDVVLHGLGSWVAAPPSEQPDGRTYWETPPAEHGWELPDPYAVQGAILHSLRTLRETADGQPGEAPKPWRMSVPTQRIA